MPDWLYRLMQERDTASETSLPQPKNMPDWLYRFLQPEPASAAPPSAEAKIDKLQGREPQLNYNSDVPAQVSRNPYGVAPVGQPEPYMPEPFMPQQPRSAATAAPTEQLPAPPARPWWLQRQDMMQSMAAPQVVPTPTPRPTDAPQQASGPQPVAQAPVAPPTMPWWLRSAYLQTDRDNTGRETQGRQFYIDPALARLGGA